MHRLGATVTVALCLAFAHVGPSAYGEEIPRLTFRQLVDSIRANFEVSQTIKSYGGREVEIQGFIIPAGPPDLSFFLLSRVSATGNYCCEVPVGQDETVYVYAAKGVKILYDPLRVYKVRGAFEAGGRPVSLWVRGVVSARGRAVGGGARKALGQEKGDPRRSIEE